MRPSEVCNAIYGNPNVLLPSLNYWACGESKLSSTFRAEVWSEADDWCRENCVGDFELFGPDFGVFESVEDCNKFAKKWLFDPFMGSGELPIIIAPENEFFERTLPPENQGEPYDCSVPQSFSQNYHEDQSDGARLPPDEIVELRLDGFEVHYGANDRRGRWRLAFRTSKGRAIYMRRF